MSIQKVSTNGLANDKVIDIAAGADGSVFVLDIGGQVFRWLGKDKEELDPNAAHWQAYESYSEAERIAVDSSGVPWIIDKNNSIFRGVDGQWQELPGKAVDIAAGSDGSMWMLSLTTRVFFWKENIFDWEQHSIPPDAASNIAIDELGNPWLILGNGSIGPISYFEIGKGWKRLSSLAYDIATGPSGSIWITSLGGLLRWNGSSFKSELNHRSPQKISVGVDETPWYIRSDSVYRYSFEPANHALSPSAYLADLLRFVTKHVETESGKKVSPKALSDTFHQSFELLSVDRKYAEDPIRQARICVEVLRSYLASNPPNPDEQQALNQLEQSYLISIYREILLQIGVSYEELRISRADSQLQEQIAGRLGIGVEHLRNRDLLLDLDTLTEQKLSEVFGMPITSGDLAIRHGKSWVFDKALNSEEEASRPKLLSWQEDFLEKQWFQKDWAGGRINDSLPLIDPDLLSEDHFGPINFRGSDRIRTYPIYWFLARKRQVENWLSVAKSREKNLDGFDDILSEDMKISRLDIKNVYEKYQKGGDVETFFMQKGLIKAELEYLYKMILLAEVNESIPERENNLFLNDEWEEIYSISIQAQKRLSFHQWRKEEYESGFSLSPRYFRLDDSQRVSESSNWSSLMKWRLNASSYRKWYRTLESRVRQKHNIYNSLRRTTDEINESWLPRLRDLLINAATTRTEPSEKKAARLSSELFIDMRMSGCHITTRVAQAMNSLQSLILELRNNESNEQQLKLKQSRNDFENTWDWMSSYSRWKSVISAFIHPENFCLPSLVRPQSPKFLEIVETLQVERKITPKRIFEISKSYQTYLDDLSNLEIKSVCWARAGEQNQEGLDSSQDLAFLFAISENTKSIYWSTYKPRVNDSQPSQTFWKTVPNTDEWDEIIGASLINSDSEICLFLGKSSGTGAIRVLGLVKYNLNMTWESNPVTQLKTPEDIQSKFKVLIVKNSSRSQTTKLLLFGDNGGHRSFYLGSLNRDASSWLPQRNYKDERYIEKPFLDLNNVMSKVRFFGKERGERVSDNVHPISIFRIEKRDLSNLGLVYSLNNTLHFVVIETVQNSGLVGDVEILPLDSQATENAVEDFMCVVKLYGDFFILWKQFNSINQDVGVYYQRFSYDSKTDYLDKGIKEPTRRTKIDLNFKVPFHYGFFEEHDSTDSREIQDKIFVVNTKQRKENYFSLIKHTLSKQITDIETFIPLNPFGAEIVGHSNKNDETEPLLAQSISRKIRKSYKSKSNSNTFNRTYLHEAYYFLPATLGYRLQQEAYYPEALHWYKKIYAYNITQEMSPTIFPFYEIEAADSTFYADSSDLTLASDTIDLHQISSHRKGTYYRFILLNIIVCLSEIGDLEFTRDTNESLDISRNAYILALGIIEGENLEKTKVTQKPLVFYRDETIVRRADSTFAKRALPKFNIMPNAVISSLKSRAISNLRKLRECRNIAGLERQVPFYSLSPGMNGITYGSTNRLLDSASDIWQVTQYRYKTLIERVKELISLAQQVESAYLSSLQSAEASSYNAFKANQDIQIARTGVQLQGLRVAQARDNLSLARLQKDRSEVQSNHYQNLIQKGLLEQEQGALDLMSRVWKLQAGASGAYAASAIASAFNPIDLVAKLPNIFGSAGSSLSSAAAATSSRANQLSTLASYERRKQEWKFQARIAQQDIRVGAQQISIANQSINIAQQEYEISQLQVEQSKEVVDFLANQNLNAELYAWMSVVLRGVYSYFLHQATAMARLAELQLAFERQEVSPSIIQPDYFDASINSTLAPNPNAEPTDRLGLTGSARLLQDIYKLDQYAFTTAERKLQLTKTISISHLDPFAFQQLRESGELRFNTPMILFDQDFPGHYLRLIKKVRLSVIALISPTEGIKATLSSSGNSRVVTGLPTFQTIPRNIGPESIALTSPTNVSGLFELQQESEFLLPFEGLGVDTDWQFLLPKAANSFDFSTIADVLITIEYTALHSEDYRRQVIQELDRSISADRPFSFRQEFADQWYDLHNLESDSELIVRFQTRREDFPPNINELSIQQIVFYFARKEGEAFEVEVSHLYFFNNLENPEPLGGQPGQSVDGIISTRQGNASSAWASILGENPSGEWELALSSEMRQYFENELIEDILFVITFGGETPPWPE